MQSSSEENYLKAIYALYSMGSGKVSLKAIAEKLNNNPASAIDMLKKLSAKKLIQYDKSKGPKLTDKGMKLALAIVRKHRLWEVFLAEKLGYSWDEVHDIAEQLEHVTHKDLAERLDKFLDFPEYDPHGDPIPKSDGKLPKESGVVLSEFEAGKSGTVVAVNDSSTSFLKYLIQLKIGIGTKIKVVDTVEFDESMNIIIDKSEKINVSRKFCDSILLSKKLKD
jgi:DtxR family Mn-dependent transcriptional regulator